MDDYGINYQHHLFDILRWFYFHKTSHLQRFAKIKPSREFPSLQYIIFGYNYFDLENNTNNYVREQIEYHKNDTFTGETFSCADLHIYVDLHLYLQCTCG